MKSFLVLFVILLSFKSFATSVQGYNLSPYKKSVKIALSQNPLSCLIRHNLGDYEIKITNDDLIERFNDMQQADLNQEGSQPLLIFSYISSDRSIKSTLAVTTSADYKSVSGVTIEHSNCEIREVQKGDLKNPKIALEQFCNVILKAECK